MVSVLLLVFSIWITLSHEQGGRNVINTCSAFCIDSACYAATGTCLFGCQSGFAGPRCNVQCCSNCKNCTLAQGRSIVYHECAENFYQLDGECKPCSENCARNVSSSSLVVCRQTDGHCKFGCKNNYYGEMCAEQCSGTCRGHKCNFLDGACLNGCTLPVLTGERCMESCSNGCVQRECSQQGVCLHGCTADFWGFDCNTTCNKNCLRPKIIGTKICNATDGGCFHGCVNSTFWGSNCSEKCSSTCLYRRCFFQTGNCIDGCVEQFQGPKCSDRINDEYDTLTKAIAAGASGVVVLIAIIIVCIVCFNKHKNKL